MFNLLSIAAGLLVLVATSVGATVLNISALLPATTVIVACYAGARRDLFGALLATLVVGLVGGASIGPTRGVDLLALLLVVFATRWARRRLPLGRAAVAAGWATAASVVHDVSYVAIAALLLPGVPLAGTLLRVSPAIALLTGLVALPFNAALGALEPTLHARQAKTTLFR